MEHVGELLRRTAAGLPGGGLGPALAWSLAAGPELAARARFRSLRGGVLTLEAADAGARLQIESVSQELRRALNRMLGSGAVQGLAFEAAPR